MAIDVVPGPLAEIFNRSFSDKTFPFLMKMANVCPIFKKGDSTSKENYIPISVLPSTSKIFERIMFNQSTITSLLNCSLCLLDSEKVIAHNMLYYDLLSTA